MPSATVTFPVRAHADDRGLGPHRVHHSRARLDVQAEPDAEQAAFGRECSRLFGAELVVVDHLDGLFERLRRTRRDRASIPVGSVYGSSAGRARRCGVAIRGDRCRARARATSTICSRATVSNIHGPRYAPRPHVFVHTERGRIEPSGDLVRAGEQHADERRPRRRSRRPGTRPRPRRGRRTCRAAGRRRRARTCTRRRRRARGSTRSGSRAGPRSTSPCCPSRRAASATTSSSRGVKNFCPNPPPTSSPLTRTRCAGTPVTPCDRLLGLVRVLRAHPRSQLAARRLVLRRRCRASPSAPACGGAAKRLRDDVRVVAVDATALRARARSGRPSPGRRSSRARGARSRRRRPSAASTSTTAGSTFDLDLDELGRVLGEVAALGDDERDRLADEAHVAVGQRAERRAGHLEQQRRLQRSRRVRSGRRR